MSEPYVGEIKIFGGNFAPRGWAFCDGQLLAVSENDALFSLLGTIYGGDGRTTFGLPDLRGRVPIHVGTGPGLPNYRLGAKGGTENVTLIENQLPSHTHAPACNSSVGTSDNPASNVWAAQSSLMQYAGPPAATPMKTDIISFTGGSQPHNNIGPYLTANFIISLFGIYPSRQ